MPSIRPTAPACSVHSHPHALSRPSHELCGMALPSTICEDGTNPRAVNLLQPQRVWKTSDILMMHGPSSVRSTTAARTHYWVLRLLRGGIGHSSTTGSHPFGSNDTLDRTHLSRCHIAPFSPGVAHTSFGRSLCTSHVGLSDDVRCSPLFGSVSYVQGPCACSPTSSHRTACASGKPCGDDPTWCPPLYWNSLRRRLGLPFTSFEPLGGKAIRILASHRVALLVRIGLRKVPLGASRLQRSRPLAHNCLVPPGSTRPVKSFLCRRERRLVYCFHLGSRKWGYASWKIK
ncbi:hypothetical protein C8Q74DRAFT_143360 [Fomes fomentarius]|nr:hypothetical protein C8Q74DRAFT_143360 [Fomes fomentarius]